MGGIRLMVGILHMTQGLAHVGLLGQEDLFDLAGEGVQWHSNILGVPDFLKLNVGNFLVVDQSWVMGGHEAWQFREIGSHFD